MILSFEEFIEKYFNYTRSESELITYLVSLREEERYQYLLGLTNASQLDPDCHWVHVKSGAYYYIHAVTEASPMVDVGNNMYAPIESGYGCDLQEVPLIKQCYEMYLVEKNLPEEIKFYNISQIFALKHCKKRMYEMDHKEILAFLQDVRVFYSPVSAARELLEEEDTDGKNDDQMRQLFYEKIWPKYYKTSFILSSETVYLFEPAINNTLDIDEFVKKHILGEVTALLEFSLNDPSDRIKPVEWDEVQNYREDKQDIFQWYIVSEYIGKKMLEKGEPVVSSNDGNYYWGRTTYGQALSNDSVIWQIYEEE